MTHASGKQLNTISYLLDQDDSILKNNFIAANATKNNGISLDSCLVCLKTRDRLLHLLTHLQGTVM